MSYTDAEGNESIVGYISDTLENRNLLERVANSIEIFLEQINMEINEIPKLWNPGTGLKAP